MLLSACLLALQVAAGAVFRESSDVGVWSQWDTFVVDEVPHSISPDTVRKHKQRYVRERHCKNLGY